MVARKQVVEGNIRGMKYKFCLKMHYLLVVHVIMKCDMRNFRS